MSQQYWFKRRRYGWGWTPVAWQGWVCLGVYLAVALLSVLVLPMKSAEPTIESLILFCLIFLSATLLLIGTIMAKGPQPHWRWGKKPSDNSDEDY